MSWLWVFLLCSGTRFLRRFCVSKKKGSKYHVYTHLIRFVCTIYNVQMYKNQKSPQHFHTYYVYILQSTVCTFNLLDGKGERMCTVQCIVLYCVFLFRALWKCQRFKGKELVSIFISWELGWLGFLILGIILCYR